MRWLIDGYNLIRRDPDLRAAEGEGLEAGRRALLRLVSAAARRTGDPLTVIFDGALVRGAPPSGGQIQVLYSRPPETADDVLVRLARQHREGAIIVTADRAVQDAARRAGATVIGADGFLSAIEDARATSGEGGRDAADADDENDEADRRSRRGGNPRRLSKDARATARALRRLRGR